MDIRLLGPVQICGADGGLIRLHRRKERLALSILALTPGRVVAVDRLVDLLWGYSPPATARATLQTLISRIRSALRHAAGSEQPVLPAQGSGYALKVSPASIDLHRFNAMVDQARSVEAPHVRSAELTTALELWQGPALAGTAVGDVRDKICTDLEESRFAVVSERIDADLAAGRHSELIPELSGLAARYPLREQVHGQLMLALYRAGRRADALAAYRRAHRTLVAELGLEPGRQLHQLGADIVGDSPNLSHTPYGVGHGEWGLQTSESRDR